MISDTETAQDTVTYVYGIVPADVETEPNARGVGDPPSPVEIIRHGDIAALVSEISAARPFGRPEDLTAHARLLDAVAAVVPVLPLRFGSGMTNRDVVAVELLANNYDDFLAILRELEGMTQFVVTGRYVEEVILKEVLADSPQMSRLRERTRKLSENEGRDEKIVLGEGINKAIGLKRIADTGAMRDALEPLCAEITEREAAHELDAVNLACLGETGKRGAIRDAVEEFANRHEGRIELRLLGPMAPYDFVMAQEPQD